MTESEASSNSSGTDTDPVSALRAEFAQQFDALKAEFAEQMDSVKQENDRLKEQNASLNRELVRSALTTPAQPAPEPTAEELHEQEVQRLAERTLGIMRYRS